MNARGEKRSPVKMKKEDIIVFSSLMFTFAILVLQFITAVIAYVNGGYVTIYFNHYGELYIEVFVMYPMMIVIAVVAIIYSIKRL